MLNCKQLSDITGVNESTISNQYREVLSEYGKDKKTWWQKYKWIYEKWYHNQENIGEKLNLDEKYINWEYSTILSNSDRKRTNKITAIVKGVKAGETIKKFKKFFSKKERNKVKEVSVDMSNSMIKVVREVFANALIVIDRFHLRKLINEMIWVVKARLKVKISREEDKKSKSAKKKWKEYKPKRYGNGETRLEMLCRSHYQIRKNSKDWSNKEKKRWGIMQKIACFKSLISMYETSSKLYDIYEKKVWKEEWVVLMTEWLKIARKYKKIPELLHLANTIEKRLDHITNYFVSRHNNWYAEWLNSRIWKVLRDSKGFVNNDYMIFRLTSAL